MKLLTKFLNLFRGLGPKPPQPTEPVGFAHLRKEIDSCARADRLVPAAGGDGCMVTVPPDVVEAFEAVRKLKPAPKPRATEGNRKKPGRKPAKKRQSSTKGGKRA